MSNNTFEYVELILDKLSSLKAMSSGKFFGGQGISSNAVQFAMIMGDAVFFVVDDSTRDEYIEMGTSCFWYTKKTGRVNVRKYHQVPQAVIENQKLLLRWSKNSIAIATKLKTKK